jgi:hypothetical protein
MEPSDEKWFLKNLVFSNTLCWGVQNFYTDSAMKSSRRVCVSSSSSLASRYFAISNNIIDCVLMRMCITNGIAITYADKKTEETTKNTFKKWKLLNAFSNDLIKKHSN